MNTKTIFLILFSCGIITLSCKKQAGPEGPQGEQGAQGAQGVQGPVGPVLTGNLKGYISHFDASGVKLLSALSGDSVRIDGTSTVTVTDANGMYAFNGLVTGNYNLSVKSAGFGPTKIQNIAFTGGTNDLYRNTNISRIPSGNVTSFLATQTLVTTNSVAVNNINISCTVTPQPYAQTIIVFVGNPGSTTVNAISGNNVTYYTFNINPNVTTLSKNIPTYEFYDVNYASGNTVYLAATLVGANVNASSYIDFSNNRTVFTAVSSSAALASVVLQ